jgi:hypothetical protein
MFMMPLPSNFDQLLKTAYIIVIFLTLSGPLLACSMAACVNGGPEFNRSFVVKVSHDGRPLQRVCSTKPKLDRLKRIC